jgi:DUF4097 and DUF4098 domain-containing protein YvlB
VTTRLSMRVRVCVGLLVGLGAVAGDGPRVEAASETTQRDRGTTVSQRGDGDTCAHYQVNFDDQVVARAEEQVDVPRASVERLTAQTGRGGVLVIGWNGDAYRVRACKAAAGDTLSEAQARVASMSLRVDGGRLSVTEPDGEWIVHYIVLAPAGGAVSLEATNGPLAVRGFSGTAQMVSRNGPISINHTVGQITARANNGPVTVSASGGDITARTDNGPITVSLADRQWQGEKLDASTQNGPLSIDVPRDYESGVEVRMGRHAPFRCASSACQDGARRTWDDGGRKVVMGSDTPIVRVSTVNGPVTIGERD